MLSVVSFTNAPKNFNLIVGTRSSGKLGGSRQGRFRKAFMAMKYQVFLMALKDLRTCQKISEAFKDEQAGCWDVPGVFQVVSRPL